MKINHNLWATWRRSYSNSPCEFKGQLKKEKESTIKHNPKGMETLRGFPVFVSWDLRHFVILPCKTVHLSTEKMYVRRKSTQRKSKRSYVRKSRKKVQKHGTEQSWTTALQRHWGKHTLRYSRELQVNKGRCYTQAWLEKEGKHKIITQMQWKVTRRNMPVHKQSSNLNLISNKVQENP